MAIETTSGSNALSSTLVASATTGRGVARPAAKGDDANSEPTVVETARLAPSPEAEEPLARRHDDVEEEAVDPAAEKAPRELAMSLSLLKFVGQASLVDEAMLPS